MFWLVLLFYFFLFNAWILGDACLKNTVYTSLTRQAVSGPGKQWHQKGQNCSKICITINIILRSEHWMWTVHEIIGCLLSSPCLAYQRLFRRAKHQSCYKCWKQNKLVCKQLQNAKEIFLPHWKGRGIKIFKLFTICVCLHLFYYFQKTPSIISKKCEGITFIIFITRTHQIASSLWNISSSCSKAC